MRVDGDENGKGDVTSASTDNTPGGPSAAGVDDETRADADALALAEAEAEAEEAEARAAAAHARARAIRLRREAQAQDSDEPVDSELTPPADTDLDASAVPIDAEEAAAEDHPTAAGDDATTGDDATNDATRAGVTDSPVQIAGEPRRRWRRRPGLKAVAVGLAVVIVLAALGACGYMVWHHHTVTQERQRTAEFAAAARQSAVTLMSLDFNRAKDDVQRVIDNSTGEFKKDFEASADGFVKALQESKAVSTTTVNASAVQSMTDDSAVVLVAAATKVTNSAGSNPEPRPFRLSVTVKRDGEQLKLARVEFVP